ncbi:hypothetical protein LCGC14_2286150 [marine sediment metagenome]|uniref:Uncharacterized protein n=1 Tax=marine sediment metagenome TaxID=412755 RepID=A0A0F9F575_9ZZZZ
MEQLRLNIDPAFLKPQRPNYRIKIVPPDSNSQSYPLRHGYEITDGPDGRVIKRGSSASIRGRMGAYYAAEKTIKRLMLKEVKSRST